MNIINKIKSFFNKEECNFCLNKTNQKFLDGYICNSCLAEMSAIKDHKKCILEMNKRIWYKRNCLINSV